MSNVVSYGPHLEISRERITPGEYCRYRLGEIDLTKGHSLIWWRSFIRAE